MSVPQNDENRRISHEKRLLFDLATVAGSSGWNAPDFLPRLPAAKVAWMRMMHVAGSWEMKIGQSSLDFFQVSFLKGLER